MPIKRRLNHSISKPLVWIDCEMTGLDIQRDFIIEICCIITDGHLNIIDDEGYESTVHVPKKVLDNMGEWCVEQHGKSGLTAKVLANPQNTLAKVQQELLEYIQSYIPEPRTALMAGNTIHMDKFFMMKDFPKVVDHLHYRLVDVSSIAEVGKRQNPKLMNLCPRKQANHTARSDIIESINQLKWYTDNYLRSDIPDNLSKKAKKESSDSSEIQEPAAKKAKVNPEEVNAEIVEIESTEIASAEPEVVEEEIRIVEDANESKA